MITVGMLIEQLKMYDPEMDIVIQKDSEGNGFSPMAGADPNGVYVAESAYGGQVFDAEWSADDCGFEEEEWNELLDQPRTLIIYPIN